MSASSSIFSFDTLRGLPRPGRAFGLTVGLCVALRLVISATVDRLDRIPAQCTNKRFMYLEQKLVRENPEPPRIALMGNSLMRYGLIEGQVAAAAGIPPERVVNLGVENGCAWDALLLLRRNLQLAANLDLIIYAIQPSEIHFGSRSRRIDFFYQYSTLGERLTTDRWSDCVKLTLDWFWPYRSQHRDLAGWLTGLTGEDLYDDPAGLKPAWNAPLYDHLKARAARYEQPPAPDEVIGVTGEVSLSHLHRFKDLITFCRDRNIRLHFMTTPTRRVYDQVVTADPSFSDGLARFEHLLDVLGVPTTRTHRWPLRDRIGLIEREDFLDYCHLTPVGAGKLTRTVTADLQAQGILPLKSESASAAPQHTQRSVTRTRIESGLSSLRNSTMCFLNRNRATSGGPR